MSSEREKIKCVVWDLDNTLWEGTLLEDEMVILKSEILHIIQTLDERGILQSIASKNDYHHALNKLKEFNLDKYFIYPEISWDSKSESIKKIAKNINIDIATFAFIDDQQFEREEVQFFNPQVRCIDAVDIPKILSTPEMNPRFITADSKRRREMYQSDIIRNKLEQEFTDGSEEFLKTLEMRFTIDTATEEDLTRAEELTFRTHQLNTTGYTYTYDELNKFRISPNHRLIITELTDKYGCYGKIGLVLLEITNDAWIIKLFLMSCRVMSRGVGTVLINYLRQQAAKRHMKLLAEFIPTDKNRMMHMTYKFNGFSKMNNENDVILLQNDLSTTPPLPDYLIIQDNIKWCTLTLPPIVSLKEVPSFSFLFPGFGDHYEGMGKQLYQSETLFREYFDLGNQYIKKVYGFDIYALFYVDNKKMDMRNDVEKAKNSLNFKKLLLSPNTSHVSAAKISHVHAYIFLVEYALAQLLIKKGIKPQAMIGYSIGEYVAACLAGIFSLEDCLDLIIHRAQLIEKLPSSAMLAVPLSKSELQPYLEEETWISAISAPALCVVSGTLSAIDKLAAKLQENFLAFRRLPTQFGFHSPLLDPICNEFQQKVVTIVRNIPHIKIVSNVSGGWLQPEEALSIEYWVTHLSQPVLFMYGLTTLLAKPLQILLEVGPGNALSSFVMQHPDFKSNHQVFPVMRHREEDVDDITVLNNAFDKISQINAGWQKNNLSPVTRKISNMILKDNKVEIILENGAEMVEVLIQRLNELGFE